MLLLAFSKTTVIITAGLILCIQWFLAIVASYFLFKDKGLNKSVIGWNIFIMFGVLIGPLTYLIHRNFKKNK